MKNIIIIFSLILLFSCATQNTGIAQQPKNSKYEISSNNPSVLFSLGEEAFRNNDIIAAINLYQKAMRFDNDDYIKIKLCEAILFYFEKGSIDSNKENEALYTRTLMRIGDELSRKDATPFGFILEFAIFVEVIGLPEKAFFILKKGMDREETPANLKLFFYLLKSEIEGKKDTQLLVEISKMPMEDQFVAEMVAEALFEGADIIGAKIYYEKILEKWGNSDSYNGLLNFYRKTFFFEEFDKIIETTITPEIDIDPFFFRTYLLRHLLITKDYEKIIVFEEAIVDSQLLGNLFYLSEAFLEQKNYKKAAEVLENLSEEHLEIIGKDGVLGELIKILIAAEDFQKVFEMKDKYSNEEDVNIFLFRMMDFFIEQAVERNYTEEKVKDFSKKLFENFDEQVQYVFLIEYYKEIEKDFSDILKKIEDEKIKELNLLVVLSESFFEVDNIEKAKELLELREYKNSSTFSIMLKFAFYNDDYERVEKMCREKFTKNDTLDILGYSFLTMSLGRLGKEDEQINFLKEAIGKFPLATTFKNNLGYILLDYEEELELAEKLLLGAILLEPTNFNYWDSVGWLRYKQGNYAFALESLSYAIENKPLSSEYNYHVGVVLLELDGNFERAREYFENSIKINDDDNAVKLSQEALEKNEKGEK